MLIDLQLHSTYSDGYLTPTELAKFINDKGIRVASLTDHNTVGGLKEFKRACKQYGIKAINGMEIYCKYKRKKLNILWYNFDKDSPELHEIMRESQIRRKRQMRKALEIAVEKKGFQLDIDKILDKYTHYVPINHVVDDILSIPKNVNIAKKDLELKVIYESYIMSEYLRNKKIGKLKNAYISLERIIKLREKIGGQLIICHPAKHKYITREKMEDYKKAGVDGVEIISPHHSLAAIMYIQRLAREFDMVETGGSDFHKEEGDSYLIQNCYDYFKIDSDLLRGINKIIK